MRYYILYALFFLWTFCAEAQTDTAVSMPHGKTLIIGQINISGNKKTKRDIILRELSIAEGDRIASDSLEILRKQTWLRLQTVGLFTEMHVAYALKDSDTINWNIQLKERWFIIPEPTFQLADRNFNVWWTEQNRDIRRTIIGITLRHKNFRGNLENLAVTAQVGYTQKLYFEYGKPYIDKKKKHGLGFGFGMAESEEIFYKTDSNKLKFIKTRDHYIASQFEASVFYTYRPAYASRHIIRLSYKDFRVSDTVVKLNNDYYKNGSDELRMLELNYRYELNKTDNWNYPLTGIKFIGQLFARMGIEGIDYQLFGTAEAGYFKRVAPKWYASAIFRGRVTTPEKQPYVFRNALGTKFEYVRGYEYYVIDGSQYGILRLDFKRELFNFYIRKIPIKYLPVIPVRIYPKLFADVGYVANRYEGNSFLNNKMLYSAGVGVDIFTAYDIKIRIEYAWNHLGQKGLFLHFNSE